MERFNMTNRKVCVVTGTRAEFGLMQILMQELQADPEINLQIIATGMHLSPEFNLTYRAIEESGFTISKKIEVLLSSDSTVGVSKSMGLAMISFSEAYSELKPDIIIVLGDRFEIFGAVSAAMISRIPIGHIHGGEATEGLIDEPIRHSITKMAHLHFTATEFYRKRVIQLGEQPDRVFFTGTPGIDNIYQLDLLNKADFEASIDFKLGDGPNILVTFHPVTFEEHTAEGQFKELLAALAALENARIVFTMPNADTDGRVIIQQINEFAAKSCGTSKAFTSLGQLRYLSALKNMDLVLGNSSSG
jgi:GDP/UDP-N,N'-diacetylbacillosamine 2-epimerase (hydrolysing)